MSYKVISFFTDLQDLGYPYNPGDKFPRDGMTVSNERIAELASKNNKQGKPLIKPDNGKDDFSKYMNPPVEETADTDKTYTKTDINRLSTAELKELATKENLSDVESKSGGELKKELIEHFNL
jgi:hypothetical protein